MSTHGALASALPRTRAIATRPRISARAVTLWGVALGLGALAAWYTVWAGADLRWGLITAMIVVTASPFVVRLVQGKFDPFEPILVLGLGIAVVFVARPIIELADHLDVYAGYFVRPGFNGAMAIVLIGTASLYLGYALPVGRRAALRLAPPSSSWDDELAVRFATRMVLIGGFLYLVQAALAGGGITEAIDFFIGRGATPDFENNSSGWLYLGPYLTLPASLLFLSAWRRTGSRTAMWRFWAALAVGVLITVPRGDRTYVLALFLPVVVFPFLRRARRPRLVSILIALLVGILLINFLQVYRNVATRSQASQTLTGMFTDPLKPFHSLLTGGDLSFFSVLELQYEVQPRGVPFHPGATPLSILAGPIPQRFWHNKPQSGAVPVTIYLFFQQSLVSRASNDPAMFGDMYGDDGFPTVILYSLILGMCLRAFYVWAMRYERRVGAQLFLASLLPLLIILLRGAITDTLARSVVLTVPLLVAARVCSRPRGQRLPHFRHGAILGRGAAR